MWTPSKRALGRKPRHHPRSSQEIGHSWSFISYNYLDLHSRWMRRNVERQSQNKALFLPPHLSSQPLLQTVKLPHMHPATSCDQLPLRTFTSKPVVNTPVEGLYNGGKEAHRAWNKVSPVIAAETVGDFHDGQIMVIRIGNRHITLQRNRRAGHILDAHPRQIRTRLLHVGDLVGHHLLGLIHQRRHLATSGSIQHLAGAKPNSKHFNSEVKSFVYSNNLGKSDRGRMQILINFGRDGGKGVEL